MKSQPMRLGPMMRLYRRVHEMDIRSLAREIGVSWATLSRIERGHAMDGNTMARILRWLLDKETRQ